MPNNANAHITLASRAIDPHSGLHPLAAAGPTGRKLERLARIVNPGGWAIEAQRPIATLLGSCVAVCLYDPQLGLAGLNHFLLPKSKNTRRIDNPDAVLHGDYAMEVLRNAMYNHGAASGRLVAKAFGGGNVVGAIQMAIGERNAEFAREWLEREGIPLLASDFGGCWSRKVVFDPVTGDVFSRRNPIDRPDAVAMARAEADYAKSLLIHQPLPEQQGKKIELF